MEIVYKMIVYQCVYARENERELLRERFRQSDEEERERKRKREI